MQLATRLFCIVVYLFIWIYIYIYIETEPLPHETGDSPHERSHHADSGGGCAGGGARRQGRHGHARQWVSVNYGGRDWGSQ
jgi:hypothetical protein